MVNNTDSTTPEFDLGIKPIDFNSDDNYISPLLSEDTTEATPEEKEVEPVEVADEKLEVEPIEEEVVEESEEDEEIEIDYGQFANLLASEGIFTDEELEGVEFKDSSDILNLIKNKGVTEAEQNIKDFFEQAGQDAYDAYQAVILEKVSPEEYFTKSAKVASFEDMDLEYEENQEKVLRQYFKNRGIEDEAINARIERLKNIDELHSESEFAKDELVKKEKSDIEIMVKRAKEEAAAKEQESKMFADSISAKIEDALKQKQFNGLPVTKQAADKAKDYLTTIKYRDKKTGDLYTELQYFLLDIQKPQNIDRLISLALMEGQGWSTKTIEKKAISKSSSESFMSAFKKKKASVRKSPIKDNFKI